jgi:hypothetical protein
MRHAEIAEAEVDMGRGFDGDLCALVRGRRTACSDGGSGDTCWLSFILKAVASESALAKAHCARNMLADVVAVRQIYSLQL